MSLIKHKEVYLTRNDIDRLFPLVNRPYDWQVDLHSMDFVEKIIELWFREQGYDFWNNPFPEVVEITIDKNKEVIFKYIL